MPVTAFLAVSSKAAGFFVLLNLVNGPFEGMSDFLLPILGFIATLTILFGNLAACAQRNLKRLLGLSGVAHAGYLLVGVIAAMLSQTMQADWVIIFYLFTYLMGSFAVFGVMGLANVPDDAEHEFSHYEALGQKNPFLAFVLSCGVCSLAGVPPFAGFIAKLLLFVVAFKAKLYFSLAAMVVGVVISIYYYFGWLREALFIPRPKFSDEEDNGPDPWDGLKLGGILKLSLVILTAATLVFGIWQGALGDAF
jgi:NADH-quinone oxidoreductase subunit N